MKHRVYYLVSRALKEVFKEEAPGLAVALSNHQVIYPKPEFGDYASNVALLINKIYPQLAPSGPQALAEKLAAAMKGFDTDREFSSIQGVAGFVNFTLSPEHLLSKPAHILELGENYGKSNLGEKQTVLVEYLSPNTNKPLHLGHIRNGVLGMSVTRLLQSQQYDVVKTSIINDRGIHICKSMLAWQKWGEGTTPESTGKKGDHFVGDWYVKYSEEEKKNPALLEEAQEMLRKWEQGDKEIVELWQKMRQWVLDGFNETYKVFGFAFDKEYFESEVYEQGKAIVEEGLQKGIFSKNEKGNTVFKLNENFGLDEEGNTRMATVLRADGTSLYVTQDLGLAAKRNAEYKLNELVYVVGSEQKFHFQVLFEILKTLGYSWADKLFHLAYGMVYLPEGKMKSREGTVVDADDLLTQLEALATQEIKKRDEKSALTEEEVSKRSRMIALAAIKFYFLCNRPTTDIYFNPKESIAFEGFTGPYLQYTHARIYGILRKSNFQFPISNYQILEDKNLNITNQEMAVLRKLHQFPEILENASAGRLPSVLCKYLFEVAQVFNTFYQAVPVLSEENLELKNFRLALIKSTAQVIKNGLYTLGIEAPEEM